MPYSIHEFAELAGVTVKALHHYDRLGLLKPRRTDAGYRIYAENDLERLEQIVALRFIGLPLKQIRILLERDAPQLYQSRTTDPSACTLTEVLHVQRTVLEEKRRHIDAAICAIAAAEKALESGTAAVPTVLKKIIEAIPMHKETTDANEFMKNYYRGEAWERFQTQHHDWPSVAWSDLFRDVESALNDDPAGPRARALAERWRQLRLNDSAGDPRVHGGLLKAWNDRAFWPEAVQSRFSGFPLGEISQFIEKAFGARRREHFGEIVWVRELDTFSPEEKSRFTLATVDLYFKIGAAYDSDPASDHAEALAARWLELIESRTGSRAGVKEDQYDSYLRWIDSWPPALHQKIRGLNMDKISDFILKALAHTVIA